MTRRNWTHDELDTLRKRYADTPTAELAALFGRTEQSVYSMANQNGLKKSDDYYASGKGYRIRKGQRIGKRTEFAPGNEPWNKGMRYLAGGRAEETRFKPGHRGGIAAKVYKPIGSERLSKEGYLQRKVNDDMPLQRRWKGVHVILWEEHHGPVPDGYFVVFRNGNKRDIRLENLELISRAENMRRNTIHRYPPALKSTMRLAGRLRKAINEKQD